MIELNENKDYLILKKLAFDLQGKEIAKQEWNKADKQLATMKKNKKQFTLRPSNEVDLNPHSAGNFFQKIKAKKLNSLESEQDNAKEKEIQRNKSKVVAKCITFEVFLVLISIAIIGFAVWLYLLFNNFCATSGNWGLLACEGDESINYHDKMYVFYFASFLAFGAATFFCFWKKDDSDYTGMYIFLIILFISLSAYCLIRSSAHYIISSGADALTIILLIPGLIFGAVISIIRTLAIAVVMLIFALVLYVAVILTVAPVSKTYENSTSGKLYDDNNYQSRSSLSLSLDEKGFMTPEEKSEYEKLRKEDFENEKINKVSYDNSFKEAKELYSDYEKEFASQIKVLENVKSKLYNEYTKYDLAVKNNSCLHDNQKTLEHVYNLLYLFEYRKAETIIQANNRLDDLAFMQVIRKDILAIKNAINQLVNQQNVTIQQNNAILQMMQSTQKTIKAGLQETSSSLNAINSSINRAEETYRQGVNKQIELMKNQNNISQNALDYIKHGWL